MWNDETPFSDTPGGGGWASGGGVSEIVRLPKYQESANVPVSIVTTETKIDQGHAVTTITNRPALTVVFYSLVVLSMVLYVSGRIYAKKWDILDFVRVCIPPLAFTGWTMLQKSTAFDAAFPGMSSTYRTIIAVIGAVILGLAASVLAFQADQKVPAR